VANFDQAHLLRYLSLFVLHVTASINYREYRFYDTTAQRDAMLE
jgi:hypothetical protein